MNSLSRKPMLRAALTKTREMIRVRLTKPTRLLLEGELRASNRPLSTRLMQRKDASRERFKEKSVRRRLRS